MKKWNAPEIQDLDVKLTAGGVEASTTESNGATNIPGQGWVINAYYDAVKYEKCTNGQITAAKSATDS